MNEFTILPPIMIEHTLPVMGLKMSGPYTSSDLDRLHETVANALVEQKHWFLVNARGIHFTNGPGVTKHFIEVTRQTEEKPYGRFMFLRSTRLQDAFERYDQARVLRLVTLDDLSIKGNPLEVGSLLAPAVIWLLLGRHRQSAKKDLAIEKRLMSLIIHYHRLLDTSLVQEIEKDFVLLATVSGTILIHPRQ